MRWYIAFVPGERLLPWRWLPRQCSSYNVPFQSHITALHVIFHSQIYIINWFRYKSIYSHSTRNTDTEPTIPEIACSWGVKGRCRENFISRPHSRYVKWRRIKCHKLSLLSPLCYDFLIFTFIYCRQINIRRKIWQRKKKDSKKNLALSQVKKKKDSKKNLYQANA